MKYGLKIFNLIRKATMKIAWLMRDRFDLLEVKILALGLGLTLLAGVYLLYLIFADPKLYGVLSSTVALHIMASWGLGVANCLSAGLSVFATIAYNFYIQTVVVLLGYGLVVLVLRNLIQHRIIHDTVREAEKAAQSHKTKIKKYGGIGLWLFVIFPFFMTGPVVGSVIGYLLNYKPINNFLIVLSATLTSVIIYTFAGNQFIQVVERYVDVKAVETWGAIIIGVLIICFLIYHIKTIKAFLDSEDGEA